MTPIPVKFGRSMTATLNDPHSSKIWTFNDYIFKIISPGRVETEQQRRREQQQQWQRSIELDVNNLRPGQDQAGAGRYQYLPCDTVAICIYKHIFITYFYLDDLLLSKFVDLGILTKLSSNLEPCPVLHICHNSINDININIFLP